MSRGFRSVRELAREIAADSMLETGSIRGKKFGTPQYELFTDPVSSSCELCMNRSSYTRAGFHIIRFTYTELRTEP